MRSLFIIPFIIFVTVFPGNPVKAQTNTPTLPLNTNIQPRKDIYQIAPPSWYIGFKDTSLEIILYAENIDLFNISMLPYEGVTLVSVNRSANRHIAYLNLNISPNTKPGNLSFLAIAIDKNPTRYIKDFGFTYELKNKTANLFTPITAADITYQICTDRFCNGEKSNDNALMQYNEGIDRANAKKRHGGDLAGIKSKIHYLKDLGISSVLIDPVQENDQSDESYLGFGITDHYKIDPRFGNMSDLTSLSQEIKKHGLKMMMEIIPNHIGNNHWMYKNFDTGWFNFRDSFVQTNFRTSTLIDPYGSSLEKKLNCEGSLQISLPDLDQRNVHIAKYLDQLYLWWIETAGISGYRVDAFPYPDQHYMNHLCKLILSEYPKFTFYGETWAQTSGIQAAFTKNNIKGFENNSLNSVTDFVMCGAIQKAATKPQSWIDGTNHVYLTLIDDYLYQDPNKNVTFIDNHKLNRIYSEVNEDFNAWKRSVMLLLTLRGLPTIYYGTEVLMTGSVKDNEANVQNDFPGGWSTDLKNKFKLEDRSTRENEAFNFIKTLSRYRQAQKAISEGKTIQFTGSNGIYTYFRYNDNAVVMCIYSQNKEKTEVNMNIFAEITKGYSKMKNIISGEIIPISNALMLEAESSNIFELIK